MKKRILVGSTVAVLMLSGCAGEIAQMMNSGAGNQVAQSALQNSTQAAAGTTAAATKGTAIKGTTNKNCIPRMNGGSTSFFDMVKEKVITAAIEESVKSIDGMKDIKFPSKIMDTCEATARLKYVNNMTDVYYNNLEQVNLKIAEAIGATEIVKEIKSQRSDKQNISDKADRNDGISEQNQVLFEKQEKATKVDQEKISEAWGMFMTSMPKYTAVLLGWDKEIAEFSKDNLPWAIQNFGEVKNVIGQIKTIGMVAVNGKNAFDKLITTNNITINKKTANNAAKLQAKNNIKEEAKNKKEYESEMDGLDS